MGIFSAIGDVFSSGIGKIFGDDSAKRAAQRQYHKEKEFAQNSILWRVEDANRAGIHPLYALGNPGIQAGPSPGAGIPHDMSAMGQNISRAIESMRTRKERLEAQQEEAMDRALNRERTQAEIELIRQQSLSEQARRADYQRGPPSPTITRQSAMEAVGGDAGIVQTQPARPVARSSSDPAREAGSISDFGFIRNSYGGYTVAPSKDAKERTEDDLIQQSLWAWRNQIQPMFSGLEPPTFATPIRGARWKWSAASQSFQPYKNGRFYYRRGGRYYPHFW